MTREEQTEQEINVLLEDQKAALHKFAQTTPEREERLGKAYLIHVTCMDERDRFAPEATGEPYGAFDLFASPGGCFTQDRDAVNGAKKFLEIYGDKIRIAKTDGKSIVIYLMPHTCFADNHGGCAAFQSDENAEYAYFSVLADELMKLPELEGAQIKTAMYDTDTHDLVGFHGYEVTEKERVAAERLRQQLGQASAEQENEWDRFHSGYRIYVGDLLHTWCPRRNVSYQLHDKIDAEELLEGIALAIKIILSHSHVDVEDKPIVIQIDKHGDSDAAIMLTDEELLKRLNVSPLLAESNLSVKEDDILIVRTETDPESWVGRIL